MIRPGRQSMNLAPGAAPAGGLLAALLLLFWCLAGPVIPALAEEQKNAPDDEAPVAEDEKDPPSPPAKPAPAARKTAPADPKPAPPPLRFTDADLERYHRPAPLPEEGAEAPGAADRPAAPAGPPPGPNKPGRLLTKPKPRPAPPPPDPLKPFKEREAMEKFRREQIQSLRDRVLELEGRLGYLNAKRAGLLNPAPLQAGQTKAADAPNPYRPGDPFTGAGKTPIGGFFPPIPPAQTEEDRQKDKTLKIKDLIADVEKEIEAVEVDLKKAREDLVTVELRFGAGSPPP